jgi:hypothetical protein
MLREHLQVSAVLGILLQNFAIDEIRYSFKQLVKGKNTLASLLIFGTLKPAIVAMVAERNRGARCIEEIMEKRDLEV